MLPQPALFTGAIPVMTGVGVILPRRPDDTPSDLPDTAIVTQLALSLLRHMVQPAVLMDPDGRVTLVNAAGLELIAPSDASPPQGRFWWEMWPHADGDDLRAALTRAASGETASITLDCRRAVASSATLVPLEGEDGRVAKLLCLLRAR